MMGQWITLSITLCIYGDIAPSLHSEYWSDPFLYRDMKARCRVRCPYCSNWWLSNEMAKTVTWISVDQDILRHFSLHLGNCESINI